MSRLTDTQKSTIRELRACGMGYGTIANKLSLSRDTVRSFCVRNNVPTAAAAMPNSISNAKTENQSGTKIGSTVFIITTDYNEKATETLEKKLETLILNEAARQLAQAV